MTNTPSITTGPEAKQKFRILSIDDQRDILDLITICLHTQYEVIGLQEPAKAIKIIDIFEPDVVILDIMMPQITGYQLLEQIQKLQTARSIKTMFLSAKDTQLDQKYGYKLGADVYLPKPFQPDRLLKNIELLLHGLVPRPKRFVLRDAITRIQALDHAGANMASAAPTPVGLNTSSSSSSTEGSTASQIRLKRLLSKTSEENESKKKGWLG
ncbi:response regulator [Candidatus Sumerlaeota bacterium]|nr:response regulator [Candidatus Sumerlaeota bacterium]